jgi:hypothetical protein
MNPTIDHTLSGIAAIVAGIFGSRLMVASTEVASDVVNAVTPPWVNQLTGPFGALVGLGLGLVWMNRRLNRAEDKNDIRDKERDEDRKALITVVQQNSHILEDVKTHLDRAQRGNRE